MSEFALSSGRYPATNTNNVEWYSSGATQQYAGGGVAYAYDQTAVGTGASYGTFEDEPPLLEGI
jgi:hypothetical protein